MNLRAKKQTNKVEAGKQMQKQIAGCDAFTVGGTNEERGGFCVPVSGNCSQFNEMMMNLL